MGKSGAEVNNESGLMWADVWSGLRAARASGVPMRTLVKETGVPRETLRRWLKRMTHGRPPYEEDHFEGAARYVKNRAKLGQSSTGTMSLDYWTGRWHEAVNQMGRALDGQRALLSEMEGLRGARIEEVLVAVEKDSATQLSAGPAKKAPSKALPSPRAADA